MSTRKGHQDLWMIPVAADARPGAEWLRKRWEEKTGAKWTWQAIVERLLREAVTKEVKNGQSKTD